MKVDAHRGGDMHLRAKAKAKAKNIRKKEGVASDAALKHMQWLQTQNESTKKCIGRGGMHAVASGQLL
eukprot:1086295-Pelagomonas_calceolata.AAC.3